jgi:hypothetical protein
MTHFAKPDEMAKLARHPEARPIQGESGLSYLSLPEPAINPEAQQYLCPITHALQFRSVLVVPVAADGTSHNAPYEE